MNVKKIPILLLAFSFVFASGIIFPQVTGVPGPTVKIIKAVHNCWQFDAFQIHPNRYILSTAKTAPYPPAIYDIVSDRIIALPPLNELPGMPRPEEINTADRKERASKKSGLILAGKYWNWHGKMKIVYFDAVKNRAGIFLDQAKTVKTVTGSPQCKTCGGEAKLIGQYNRYYCHKCRAYVDEKDYTKEVRAQSFALMDTAALGIVWISPLDRDWNNPMEQEGIQPIGVDQEGRYFYFMNCIYFYRNDKTPGHILIHRFNIAEKKVDWKYELPVPVRVKENAAASYAINFFASHDLSKIVCWEYDEGIDENSASGWLKNPGPKGWVIDTRTKESFSFDIPVTAYGQLIDRNNKYILIGSNQTGEIVRIDCEKKREDLRIRATNSIFKFILSENSRYLFVFNKLSVEVFSWPDLAPVKRIPLNQIFPGVRMLLVSEDMYASSNGKYAAIGVLKDTGSGQWHASDKDDGFYLLQFGE